MFGWFKKKRSIKPVSLTTDPATAGFSTSKELIDSLLFKDGEITHEQLNNVCKTFLNVSVENCLYRLKDNSSYGLVFGIKNVNTMFVKDELVDITLTLVDVGLLSSIKLDVSVKELREFLEPVPFPVSSKKKEGV